MSEYEHEDDRPPGGRLAVGYGPRAVVGSVTSPKKGAKWNSTLQKGVGFRVMDVAKDGTATVEVDRRHVDKETGEVSIKVVTKDVGPESWPYFVFAYEEETKKTKEQ